MVSQRPSSLLDRSFDLFPDLLFLVNAEGVILDYRGGRYAELYAPPDAFLGRSLHSVLPPLVAARLGDAVARVAATNDPVAVDYTLPLPSGERAFEARLLPLVQDAILAVCRDVTDTRGPDHEGREHTTAGVGAPAPLAEADRESERGLGRLVEATDQVFWLRGSRSGRVLYASPAFESIFGRAVSALHGDPAVWNDAIHPDDRDRATAAFTTWVGGAPGPDAITYRVTRPDGTVRWLVDRVVTVPADERSPIGGIARDVTDGRALAHDFNGVLSVIIGNTQVALRLAPDDASVRECLERVLEASRTAETLVRRLYDTTRPDPSGRQAGSSGAGPDTPTEEPLEKRLAPPPTPFDEWQVVLRTRPNVLIEGAPGATEAAVRRLLQHSVEPVGVWGEVSNDGRPATLVVRNVADLTLAEQRRLLRWIEDGRRTQVVSTSARPLFPLVEGGQFLASLFYRLNVLRIEV